MGRKRDMARSWLAAMKPGTRIGQNEKILKLYTDFLFSWLALIFLGKDRAIGTERELLKKLADDAPNELLSRIYITMKDNISELARLRVKNENPKNGNSGFEEADRLDTELLGGNNKQIIEATLGLLYVIRCNLFHADKGVDETRDNQIMFYASKITANISESLIRELP